MPTLALWDVDHTLVDVGPAGREAYRATFQRIVGRPLSTMASFAGRTERAIIADTLAGNGVTVSEPMLRRFSEVLADEFASRPDLVARGRALPGAHDALRRLAGRLDVVQSVLTGNLRPVAVGKLTPFGLADYLDFSIGAYGSDHADRAELVKLARRRAAARDGARFDAADTVLIGDTPNDVAAGQLGGARVVAVATGFSDRAALTSAGADVVFDDLTDTDAVMRAIVDRP